LQKHIFLTMKRYFTILFAVLLLGSAASLAKSKSVANPYWLYDNSNEALSVSGITLDKNAATLTLRVISPGEWWLAKTLHITADGKAFAYRSGRLFHWQNGAYAELPFAPEAKNASVEMKDYPNIHSDSLVLCFDPVPTSASAIDFAESSDGWQILGIRTDGKPYPSSLKAADFGNAELPAWTPVFAKSVLSGRIIGYRPAMGKLRYYYRNSLTGKNDAKLSMDSLGNFSITVESGMPETVWIYNSVPALLVPGSNLELDIDAAALKAVSTHTRALAQKALGDGVAFRFSGTYAPLCSVRNDEDSPLNSISIAVPDIAKSDFRTYADYLWQKYQAKKKVINASYGNPQQRDYMDLLSQSSYVGDYIKYPKSVAAALKDSAKVAAAVSQFSLTDAHAAELGLFTDSRAAYVLKNSDFLDYAVANGLKSGKTFNYLTDLKRADDIVAQISNLKPVAEAEWASVPSQFVPVLKPLNDTVQAKVSLLSASKSEVNICKAPSVAPAAMIKTIADQYKGKVVFIDFWATWCGPCRMGIVGMKDIEKEMSAKGVVFVYVTNETSPSDVWVSRIQSMPGEHYRISNDVWHGLPGIQGIPHYFIFDKSGNKVADQEGWDTELPAQFKAIMEKALN
jgi:thiol-disulfide isomerase/thioredoxin